MEGKGSISEYRGRLDKTLTSPDLRNDDSIRTLVKNQILRSSNFRVEECENVVERRSKEVSNFLSMLRSASENDSERSKSIEESLAAWKVKQDTEELRVMYREGPEGTPFHSLLAEGYVDGPMNICMCVSCESELYQEWWPQTAIPTFKIVSSQCLQRVRTGEQISLVRMKVSWPLSSREALIHYFVFEYFQDGLVVVLLNSISDSETLSRSSHGFTRDGIPDAQDVVRIDVVGGFAIQKVTPDRSFFRTIANMDIKLDFVPPAFINFMSRQLIGSGFKLYKKEVASVSKGKEKFAKALKGPLYTRIHKALYSDNEMMGSPDLEKLKETAPMNLETKMIEPLQDNDATDIDISVDSAIVSEAMEIVVRDREALNEIEETEEEEEDTTENAITKEISEKTRAEEKKVGFSSGMAVVHENRGNLGTEVKNRVVISAEVEQALDTLEKAISLLSEYNNINQKKVGPPDVNKGILKNIDNGFVKKSLPSQAEQLTGENGNCAGLSKIEPTEVIPNEPRNSSAGPSSRHNQGKISPASPEENLSSENTVLHSYAKTRTTDSIVVQKIADNLPLTTDANGIRGDRMTKRKRNKSWFCCSHVNSGQEN